MQQKQSYDFAGNIGISEIDITPPVGIYNRCWGAATSHTAQGVHMPFYATALVIGEIHPLVIIGFDATWGSESLLAPLIKRLAETLETEESQIHVCFSHTHSGVPLADVSSEKPGADLLKTYKEELIEKLYQVSLDAAGNQQPAQIQSNYGKCNLAQNRDLLREGSYVTGYNPESEHDDTLFTARIISDTGEMVAIIVNYACHPTTLAWENDQLSPDYVGSLRKTIRKEFNVPMLFLQGCSGDLGPAFGFTGDLSVPERHGRQLAYASLASLENMGSPGTSLVFEEVKKSGADLAVWREQSVSVDTTLLCSAGIFSATIRNDLLKSTGIQDLLKKNPDNAEEERLQRKLLLRKMIGDGDSLDVKSWFARIGNILFVSFPAELYSKMQKDIRARYPDYTVICATLCKGSLGYILPESDYEKANLYQAWQTPVASGTFEGLYDLCIRELNMLTRN